MKSFKDGVEEYLRDRNNAGFKLQSERLLLQQFASFVNKRRVTHITVKLALEFATLNPKASPERWAQRLNVIRQFAKYWSTEDLRTEIPPKNMLPHSYRRKTPYIYDDIEIINLLTCNESDQPNDRFEQHVYFVLFGLLAVTGMRISEALNLECKEIDLQNLIITIRKSKFQKSRYIPIHKTTADILQTFNTYRSHCFPNHKTPQFFIDRNGNALKAARVIYVFRKRMIKIGIATSKEKNNPRIMSLRHTFAVKTLLHWYKSGVSNIDSYMPLLSTYLGHVSPSNTYWYLTATPQLLHFILARCKSYKRRVSHEDQ
jgi:site-specific recombinase XerD